MGKVTALLETSLGLVEANALTATCHHGDTKTPLDPINQTWPQLYDSIIKLDIQSRIRAPQVDKDQNAKQYCNEIRNKVETKVRKMKIGHKQTRNEYDRQNVRNVARMKDKKMEYI